jgi:hypothetical protein
MDPDRRLEVEIMTRAYPYGHRCKNDSWMKLSSTMSLNFAIDCDCDLVETVAATSEIKLKEGIENKLIEILWALLLSMILFLH